VAEERKVTVTFSPAEFERLETVAEYCGETPESFLYSISSGIFLDDILAEQQKRQNAAFLESLKGPKHPGHSDVN